MSQLELRPRYGLWILVIWVLSLGGCAATSEYAAPDAPMAESAGDADYDAIADEDLGYGADARKEAESVSAGGEPLPPPPAPGEPTDTSFRAPTGGPAQAAPQAPSSPVAPKPPPRTGPGIEPGAPGAQQLLEPLLIYTATVFVAVLEVTKAIDGTYELAKTLGGYLVRRDDHTITIRVPAPRYREALARIAKLGDVLHREETVEDVTDEYFDLQVRLQNAKAMRTRLEQLLHQAQTVEEALMVERELGRVAAEIERLEGRLKLLSELVAFSTITVDFKPRSVEQLRPGVRLPFPWLADLGLPQLLSL